MNSELSHTVKRKEIHFTLTRKRLSYAIGIYICCSLILAVAVFRPNGMPFSGAIMISAILLSFPFGIYVLMALFQGAGDDRVFRKEFPRTITLTDDMLQIDRPKRRQVVPLAECGWFVGDWSQEAYHQYLEKKRLEQPALIIDFQNGRNRIACGTTQSEVSAWRDAIKKTRAQRLPDLDGRAERRMYLVSAATGLLPGGAVGAVIGLLLGGNQLAIGFCISGVLIGMISGLAHAASYRTLKMARLDRMVVALMSISSSAGFIGAAFSGGCGLSFVLIIAIHILLGGIVGVCIHWWRWR